MTPGEGGRMRVVGVGEVTRYLRDLLEEDYNLQDLWVRGEVTNYSQSSNGHSYFSLKDETAILRCVLFGGRGRDVPTLRNGMAALAHGRLSVYEARGEYQFYADTVEDAGVGALQREFEAMRARLEAEGLFADGRKRPLPAAPRVIGVVTSLAAAALRDIVRTLSLRAPLLRVIIAPALVQGVGAADQIASAIDALNAQGEADVVIVARGGGSLEELWAFNEEAVARAIARSKHPVVTGIGHESDVTIADFVADVRASTPTAAASVVAPDMAQWRAAIVERRLTLDEQIAWLLERRQARLDQTIERVARQHPASQIADGRRRLAEQERVLQRAMSHALLLLQERARASASRLDTLSPLKTLGRGYAIVRQAESNAVISTAHQAEQARRLRIEFTDGAVVAITGAFPSPHLDTRQDTRRRRAVADVALNQLSFLDVAEASAEEPTARGESPTDNSSGHGKALPHE
jgi:exodeoxyribonuclease VII large subunit